jgi:hydroxymethylglutaryl-CoA lyase
MKPHVRITDVSPRDGFQNEPGVIATSDKIKLVQLLSQSGVDEVEVTSFVSPKRVPQLADAPEVVRAVAASKPDGVLYSALVPNEQGLATLRAANAATPGVVDKIALFTAASEEFCRRNINCSIDESIERFRPVVVDARRAGLLVRAYVSCAFACPFSGPVTPDEVVHVCNQLVELGVDELDLGDTIGAATSATTARLFERLFGVLDPVWAKPHRVTLHLHDTFGHAARCVQTALDHGVTSFDGAVAGLGGCPFASTPGHRAPGNISTELLVRTISEAGFHTRVDEGELEQAAVFAREAVARSRSTT